MSNISSRLRIAPRLDAEIATLEKQASDCEFELYDVKRLWGRHVLVHERLVEITGRIVALKQKREAMEVAGLKPKMTKDEAVDIAQNAENMTLEQLLASYSVFNAITENTPQWLGEPGEIVAAPNHEGKSRGFQMALHAAIGIATESGEFLDNFKKDLYGKNRPMRPDNAKEELGDLFYYMILAIRGLQAMGYKIEFRDIIKDNVVKLANRYIEQFEV